MSQPCHYLPPGHFFKERPSHSRRVRKSHKHMITREGLEVELGLSSSSPTLSKTKKKSK